MKHQNDAANTTAMDATSALANIVSTTAVDDTSKKTVALKKTGHEKKLVFWFA